MSIGKVFIEDGLHCAMQIFKETKNMYIVHRMSILVWGLGEWDGQ